MRASRQSIFAAVAVSSMLACGGAHAASPKDDLEKTKKEIEFSEAAQAKIDAKQEALAEELKTLQQKLVKNGDAVRKAEADVIASEEKIAILENQVKEKNKQLAEQRVKLSALVNTAIRISRLPPEALLMMPSEMGQSMKAARALKMTSDTIRDEVTSINVQLIELKKLEEKLVEKRDLLVEQQKVLKAEQVSLNKSLAQRKVLQEKLNSERQKIAQKIAQLAKKATDLQGLLDKIEQQQKESRAKAAQTKQRSFTKVRGNIRLPVEGKLVQHFGEGRNSKGIVIATRKNAQVTAPFEGEVVYAGTFLSYGKLVIIKHTDDFHTLLAGFSELEVGAGDFLLEGEPIGAMGSTSSGNRLYIELRKNNQPINPEPWMKDL